MKTIRTQSMKSSLLTAVAGLLVATAAQAQTLTLNFDSDTAGSPPSTPSGWNTGGQTGGGSTLVSDAESVSGSNSLALTTVGQYTNGVSYAEISGLSAYAPYLTSDTFSFDVRFSSVSDQQARVQLTDFGTNSIEQLVFQDGTYFAESGPGDATVTDIGSYSANTWYTVTLTTTPSTGLYDTALYQGSTLLGSASDLVNPDGAAGIDGFNLLSDGSISASTDDQTVYFDNVDLAPTAAIPEPNAIGLLAVSGLLGILVTYYRKYRHESEVTSIVTL